MKLIIEIHDVGMFKSQRYRDRYHIGQIAGMIGAALKRWASPEGLIAPGAQGPIMGAWNIEIGKWKLEE